jgi:hypothetical protein
MSAAAMVHVRLVKAFRAAGAVGKGNGKTLAEIGVHVPPIARARLFRMPLRMHVRRKWIIKEGDKFYLVEKYNKLPIEKLFDLFKK